MNAGLYIAMNGASYNMLAQTVHSNNLANSSTTGFKAAMISAMSADVVGDDGMPHGELPVAMDMRADLAPGPLRETGQAFDVAIEGDGWFSVLTADGREGYSRSGSLSIDELGFLRDDKNNQLLGTAGPIVVPEAETVEIASDGTISVRALGQGPQTLQVIERIRMVNPEAGRLSRGDDGVFYPGADDVVVADPSVRLRSGFVEYSNVNAVHELTSITSHARQFEMNIKMMQTIGEMSQSTAQLLRVQV